MEIQSASPIIPWIGGKRRLAKHILPLFPEHTCYVEPFCGAAALYFLKTPTKVEVLNDVNGELVNLYRVVRHHMEEFNRQFKWALTSRQIFKWLQITPEETLTDIQRAARFFYLQNLDWADCIRKYDREHTLIYCDPPYWGTEGYGVEFGLEQYTRIAELARSIKGKMIISVNDVPEMRTIFDGLTMKSVDINYTVGGAKRCGKRSELIITNW